MCLLVLAPVGYLVLAWTQIDGDIWRHLIDTQFTHLVGNTLVLMAGVGIGVTLVGVSLAWLTALCEFPGRRWLDWALMLPLAIPAYVYAFVVLGVLDFDGPVQSWLHRYLGRTPGDARSPLLLAWVMTAVLYPYVYLLARNSLISQGRKALDTARSLGASPLMALWRVGLPMARPGIVAGLSLALMETLADFGAVSVFNFDTFTRAIYKSWIGLFSITTAAQLASLLLLFVFAVILLERSTRGGGRIEQQPASNQLRYQLKGPLAALATGWCLLVFAVAFVVPIAQMLAWVVNRAGDWMQPQLWRLIANTFTLGFAAAVVIVGAALAVNLGIRFAARGRILSEIASLGYAIPGSVLAVGLITVAAHFDQFAGTTGQGVLVGGLVGLVLAYLVRFYRPASAPIESSLYRLRPHLIESAQLLGAGRVRIALMVLLPILTPGIFSAMLLAMVDVMKEMPATLLLRPFGWDTLATNIFNLTSEAQWERAALPALILVVVSSFPVALLIRQSRTS